LRCDDKGKEKITNVGSGKKIEREKKKKVQGKKWRMRKKTKAMKQ
jgi:hypothetical protein